MIFDYNHWLNESASKRLPAKGQEIWNKVLEILPELKKGSWEKHFDHDDTWLWSMPYTAPAGSWRIKDHDDGTEHDLSDCQIAYYLPSDDEIEGFGLYNPSGDDLEIDSEAREPLINDPYQIGRIINRSKTESWMVKHKVKGWANIPAKKFGL